MEALRPAGAILLGAGAAVGFAFQATVTKVFVSQLGGGLSALLSTWTPYVLIGTAVIGFVLQQSGLKTGALAPAMASSNSMTLAVSVIIGSTVFGETISGGGRLIVAVIGLVLAVGGIVALAAGPGDPGPIRPEHPSPGASRTGGATVAAGSTELE
jgi:hypothetical protein